MSVPLKTTISQVLSQFDEPEFLDKMTISDCKRQLHKMCRAKCVDRLRVRTIFP